MLFDGIDLRLRAARSHVSVDFALCDLGGKAGVLAMRSRRTSVADKWQGALDAALASTVEERLCVLLTWYIGRTDHDSYSPSCWAAL